MFERLPAAQAYSLGAVPYRVNGSAIEVAIADPYDLALPERLEQLTGLRVELLLASPAAIQSALKRSQGTAEVLKDVSEDFRLVMVKETDEGREETVSLEKLGDVSSPVVRLINTLLLDALAKRASDIHIETATPAARHKYRIDGVLILRWQRWPRHRGAVVSRIKVMAELDIAEKRVPQDGRFRLSRARAREIDFRVSIMPSILGEDAVMRILDKEALTDGMRGLRLDVSASATTLQQLRRAVRRALRHGARHRTDGQRQDDDAVRGALRDQPAEDKIITIEDPVEYQLAGVAADSGEREEGPDIRARAALDTAPRSGQDHGGRDPRRGDRADRGAVGAHRPPGVHDGAREQRVRRASAASRTWAWMPTASCRR